MTELLKGMDKLIVAQVITFDVVMACYDVALDHMREAHDIFAEEVAYCEMICRAHHACRYRYGAENWADGCRYIQYVFYPYTHNVFRKEKVAFDNRQLCTVKYYSIREECEREY